MKISLLTILHEDELVHKEFIDSKLSKQDKADKVSATLYRFLTETLEYSDDTMNMLDREGLLMLATPEKLFCACCCDQITAVQLIDVELPDSYNYIILQQKDHQLECLENVGNIQSDEAVAVLLNTYIMVSLNKAFGAGTVVSVEEIQFVDGLEKGDVKLAMNGDLHSFERITDEIYTEFRAVALPYRGASESGNCGCKTTGVCSCEGDSRCGCKTTEINMF